MYCQYNYQYGKYLILISAVTQIQHANKQTFITDIRSLPYKTSNKNEGVIRFCTVFLWADTYTSV